MRNQTLRQPSASDSAADAIHPHTPEVVVAHPKVARRPTQWKRATPEVIEQTATRIIPPPVARTPWQDDVRFGTLLVGTIILINSVMILTMNMHQQTPEKHRMTLQQVTRNSILPTPRTNGTAHIHSFAATKKMDEEESVRAFLKEHARLLEEMESPAPRAASFEYGNAH